MYTTYLFRLMLSLLNVALVFALSLAVVMHEARTENDDKALFHLLHGYSEVARRRKAPVEVPDDPMLHSCDVARDAVVERGTAERTQGRLSAQERVHEGSEVRSDVVRGGLQVDVMFAHKDCDEIVAAEATCLLHVVRIHVLEEELCQNDGNN